MSFTITEERNLGFTVAAFGSMSCRPSENSGGACFAIAFLWDLGFETRDAAQVGRPQIAAVSIETLKSDGIDRIFPHSEIDLFINRVFITEIYLSTRVWIGYVYGEVLDLQLSLCGAN